jgi:hypothetical protein
VRVAAGATDQFPGFDPSLHVLLITMHGSELLILQLGDNVSIF